jgi:histone acetyltransferase 1
MLVPQLEFASGSMTPYLNVSYKSKLPENSAVQPDDVEGTLYKFLPSGQSVSQGAYVLLCHTPTRDGPDYLKNRSDFKDRVLRDSREFKPLGTKIGGYSRRLVNVGRKGKGRETDETARGWEACEPEDEGAVVYEAYAVREPLLIGQHSN